MNNNFSDKTKAKRAKFIGYAELIKSFGYTVLCHAAEDDLNFNYGYFTDGTHIGYIGMNDITDGLTLSTIHIPCKSCGSGLQLEDDLFVCENNNEVLKDILKECFERLPKGFDWLTSKQKADIKQYNDFDHFKANCWGLKYLKEL